MLRQFPLSSPLRGRSSEQHDNTGSNYGDMLLSITVIIITVISGLRAAFYPTALEWHDGHDHHYGKPGTPTKFTLFDTIVRFKHKIYFLSEGKLKNNLFHC